MKTKDGIIRIKDKVYFEYYELEHPKLLRFPCGLLDKQNRIKRIKLYEEYEASKQLIEVVNITKRENYWYYNVIGKDCPNTDWTVMGTTVINNQKCKAEVKDNKAVITELTK